MVRQFWTMALGLLCLWPVAGQGAKADVPTGYAGIELGGNLYDVLDKEHVGHDPQNRFVGRDSYVLDAPVSLVGWNFALRFGAEDKRIVVIELEMKSSAQNKDACLSWTEEMRSKLTKLYGEFDGPAQESLNLGAPQSVATKAAPDRALTIRTIYFNQDNCFLSIELDQH